MTGVLLRYWLSGWVDHWMHQRFGGTFPLGTLLANLAGCFAAGFLFHYLTEKTLLDPRVRISILVGLLGGFTTFSSYAVQTLSLFRDGETSLALLSLTVSNVGGLALAWAGYELSRSI